MSLAFVLLDSGRVTGALAQADRAVSALRGAAGCPAAGPAWSDPAALWPADRGAGRLSARPAGAGPRGDRVWEARLRNNRGCCVPSRARSQRPSRPAPRRRAAHRSGQPAARRRLHVEPGFRRGPAGATPRRRWPATTRPGRPTARQAFPRPSSCWTAPRCCCPSGSNGEAAAAAAEAAGVMARLGLRTHLAEAWLVQAQAALAGGDPETAGSYAEQAAAAFRRQQRPGWALVARHVGVCAASAADRRTGPRWRGPGVRPTPSAKPAGPRSPWTRGSSQPRRRSRLGRVTGGGGRSCAEQRQPPARSVAVRVAAWHAEVLLRVATGRRGSVGPALRAGLRALDEHRAAARRDGAARACSDARGPARRSRCAARPRGCRRGPGADLGEQWRAAP